MTKFSDKILGTIQEKKIEPIAKWKFFFKNFLLWLVTLLFFFVGIFVSAMFFLVADHIELWDLLWEKPVLVLSFGLIGIFFFWGGLSIIFSLLSKFSLQNTKQGYKYPLSILLSVILLIQVFSGFALAHNDFIKRNILPPPDHLPFHERLTEERQKIWLHPEHGFLAGKIFEITQNSLIIRDRKQNTWNILLTAQTKYPRNIEIKNGDIIRIQGVLESKNVFRAEKIFPQKGKRSDMRKYMQNMRKKNPELQKFFEERGRDINERENKKPKGSSS